MQRQNVRILPANKNPTGTRCITLEIPDDDEWERDAFSELSRLGIWMLWERDASKSGSPVAKRWRRALDTWAHCDGTPTPVGVEWEDELSICESLRWNDGVLEGFCCGEWVPIEGGSGGIVPGPDVTPEGTTRPEPGESNCYNVVLPGNGRWALPFAVLPGDTVTITAISGSWHDGSLGGWRKANGNISLFGSDTGGGAYHDGGDPDAVEYHMQLIAQVGSDFQSATDGPFVVAGSGSQTLEFYANDGTPSDNSGSISFRVCVENGATPPAGDWCYFFDFKASPYGFVEDTRDGYNADWVSGQGWIAGQELQIVDIKVVLSGAITITEATIYGYLDDSDVSGSGIGVWLPLPDAIISGAIPNSGVWELSGDTSRTGSTLQLGVQSGGDAANLAITGLLLYGTGTNPFGSDNC